MSPRLTADFAKISTEFQQLPEGVYRVVIEDIVEATTKENKLPMLQFQMVVTEGELTGRKITDFVVLEKSIEKGGGMNEIGFGRVKAYAVAVLGEEVGNGEEIDTDEIKNGTCEIVVKHETDKKDPKAEARASVKKVLPVG